MSVQKTTRSSAAKAFNQKANVGLNQDAPVASRARLRCKCGSPGRKVNTRRGELFVCFSNPAHNRSVVGISEAYCRVCDRNTSYCRYNNPNGSLRETYCYECWGTTSANDKPGLNEVAKPDPRPRKRDQKRAPKGVKTSPGLPPGKVITTETPPTAVPARAVSDVQFEEVARKALKPTKYLAPTTEAIRAARRDFWDAGVTARAKLVSQATEFLKDILENQPRMVTIRVKGHVRSYRPRMPVKNGTLPVFNVAVLMMIDGSTSVKSMNPETITQVLQDIAYWSIIKDLSLRPKRKLKKASLLPINSDTPKRAVIVQQPRPRPIVVEEESPLMVTAEIHPPPRPQRQVRPAPIPLGAMDEITTDEI